MSHKFNTAETKTEIIRNNMSKESLALNKYNILIYLWRKNKVKEHIQWTRTLPIKAMST